MKHYCISAILLTALGTSCRESPTTHESVKPIQGDGAAKWSSSDLHWLITADPFAYELALWHFRINLDVMLAGASLVSKLDESKIQDSKLVDLVQELRGELRQLRSTSGMGREESEQGMEPSLISFATIRRLLVETTWDKAPLTIDAIPPELAQRIRALVSIHNKFYGKPELRTGWLKRVLSVPQEAQLTGGARSGILPLFPDPFAFNPPVGPVPPAHLTRPFAEAFRNPRAALETLTISAATGVGDSACARGSAWQCLKDLSDEFLSEGTGAVPTNLLTLRATSALNLFVRLREIDQLSLFSGNEWGATREQAPPHVALWISPKVEISLRRWPEFLEQTASQLRAFDGPQVQKSDGCFEPDNRVDLIRELRLAIGDRNWVAIDRDVELMKLAKTIENKTLGNGSDFNRTIVPADLKSWPRDNLDAWLAQPLIRHPAAGARVLNVQGVQSSKAIWMPVSVKQGEESHPLFRVHK